MSVYYTHVIISPPCNRMNCESSSPGSSEGGANDENDDVHALAPSRVLLGIALGLARAGLGAAAAKELVKAAAVRPRLATH